MLPERDKSKPPNSQSCRGLSKTVINPVKNSSNFIVHYTLTYSITPVHIAQYARQFLCPSGTMPRWICSILSLTSGVMLSTSLSMKFFSLDPLSAIRFYYQNINRIAHGFRRNLKTHGINCSFYCIFCKINTILQS